MNYFGVDGDIRLAEFAGRIAQAAHDAAEREMVKQIEAAGYDPAYWSFDLTLRMKELCRIDFSVENETIITIPGYEEER